MDPQRNTSGQIRPINRREDFTAAYPELDEVCASLGFGPGLPLQSWCTEPGWALLALARGAHPPPAPPQADWSALEISELVENILHHHHRPMRYELRRLGVLVDHVHGRDAVVREFALEPAFRRLEAGLIDHLEQEERDIFPYCLACEAAIRGRSDADLRWLEENPPLRELWSFTDDATDVMRHLSALIGAARKRIEDSDLALIQVGVEAMVADLVVHGVKEGDFLLPATVFAEERLQARHFR